LARTDIIGLGVTRSARIEPTAAQRDAVTHETDVIDEMAGWLNVGMDRAVQDEPDQARSKGCVLAVPPGSYPTAWQFVALEQASDSISGRVRCKADPGVIEPAVHTPAAKDSIAQLVIGDPPGGYWVPTPAARQLPTLAHTT
jgi:hypothetical protein